MKKQAGLFYGIPLVRGEEIADGMLQLVSKTIEGSLESDTCSIKTGNPFRKLIFKHRQKKLQPIEFQINATYYDVSLFIHKYYMTNLQEKGKAIRAIKDTLKDLRSDTN